MRVAVRGLAGLDRAELARAAVDPDRAAPEPLEGVPSYPVQAFAGDDARIVVDADDARLLVWVRQADLAWTVARPTRIRGAGDVGVWALPGAPLEPDAGVGVVAVRYRGDEAAVDGELDRAALVHRYRPARPGRSATHMASELRDAPGGALLVHLTDAVPVTVLRRTGDAWQVRYDGPELRVIGWAPTRALTAGTDWLGGIEAGSAYGMSDTARIEVAKGTCLLDAAGRPIGIELVDRTRYAWSQSGGRWEVMVDTGWAHAWPQVLDRSRGAGPVQLERCR
ncbi:MAG: hypothetical protein R3B06_28955 [Kofleriaceae bacterium]